MFLTKESHLEERTSTLDNQIAKLRLEELGQSISNDAVLIKERASADVYTPNNISPSSKQSTNSACVIVKGAEEQLVCRGMIKYAERTLPHMWREMFM